MNNPGRTKDGTIVWIAGAVVVVILAVVAFVAIRSSDSDDVLEVTVDQTSDIAVGDVTTSAPEAGREPSDTTDDDSDGSTDVDDPDGQTTTTAPIDPNVRPLPQFDPDVTDPAVGMTIPRVSGRSLTGDDMTIEADGTAKVIVFVAHWCPHCQAEVPRIVEHLRSNPMPDDVELVAVSTSVQSNAPNYPPSRWLEREEWTVPTLADSDTNLVAGYYGLSSFPYFVVADADGTVVTRRAGELTTDQFDELVSLAQRGR